MFDLGMILMLMTKVQVMLLCSHGEPARISFEMAIINITNYQNVSRADHPEGVRHPPDDRHGYYPFADFPPSIYLLKSTT